MRFTSGGRIGVKSSLLTFTGAVSTLDGYRLGVMAVTGGVDGGLPYRKTNPSLNRSAQFLDQPALDT